LKEIVNPQPKKIKVSEEFSNTLKSSLIQFLEKENKEAGKSIPEDTDDVQLSS